MTEREELQLLRGFAEAHGRMVEVINDRRRANLGGDTHRRAALWRQLLEFQQQRDALFELYRRTGQTGAQASSPQETGSSEFPVAPVPPAA